MRGDDDEQARKCKVSLKGLMGGGNSEGGKRVKVTMRGAVTMSKNM